MAATNINKHAIDNRTTTINRQLILLLGLIDALSGVSTI